jgi:hypothetical protein
LISRLTERQKELATGLSVLIVVVFGFGLGELSIRGLNLVRFGNTAGDANVSKRETRIYIDEKTGIRRQKPGKYGRIEINSLGFRGPEIPAEKPQEKIRIAFLGASGVYDPYAREEKTWPRIVTTLLDDALPGCEVDALNGGQPGYQLEHMRIAYDHYIARLNPDAVVIYASGFNIDANRLALAAETPVEQPYRESWLAAHSLFWAKVEKNIYSLRLRRNVHNQEGKLQINTATITQRFEAALFDFVKSLQESGVRVFLVSMTSFLSEGQSKAEQQEAVQSAVLYMPYMSVDGFLRSNAAYREATRRVAARSGSVFVDTASVVPNSAENFADSNHFTERGSKKFAEFLSAEMAPHLASTKCR